MTIDIWNKDGMEKAAYADCFFYPNEGVYRGNIYDSAGNMIGDYVSTDSLKIEKLFPGIFAD